ncbi:hypothetical protein GYMLUDRAFT_64509 [Collybiopsis luxurians FD-317 M1]|uniref:Protein kinase domain-containing protein n=1 Tax=Collybiopsis luxurians FD-317 M1 TaxID=944289 RepID=A0A0D0BC71_9AGAR|nr:hypothetical protein GYMLUDRAFT_64509 [Collybiopsis luxurians FD-317 M1]
MLLYIAILEALEYPRLQYCGWYQLAPLNAEQTLELVAESLKKRIGRSGELEFVQLRNPIQLDSLRDMRSACRELLDYDALGDAGDWCDSDSTLGQLGLVESGDASHKRVPLVAIYPPQFISEDVYARKAIASAAQSRPSPSNAPPPPLSIYHSVFARFRREIAILTESLHFTNEELEQACLIIDVSLRYYSSTDQRRDELSKVFFLDGQPFWQGRSIKINDTQMDPSGALQFFSGSPSAPYLYTMLGELNNGSGDDGGGGGSDPSDQAQCAYIKLVSSKQYEHVRQVSCCPALLLGLSGPILAIWGAVFADRFFFERLALIYLGPQPSSTSPSPTSGQSDIEVGIRQVAKLLRTLERCIQDIKSHYSSLTLTSNLCKSPDSGGDPSRFVHWNSFTTPQGHRYTLVYRRRLTEHMDKTVFLASMSLPCDSTFPETNVVVKFDSRYGATGHHLLAQAGLAPPIHYCQFEESIGLWVVVMDDIQGTECNRKLIGGEKESLSNAIHILHENRLVFGDLREPNVIITEAEKTICLVDFEWCGPCVDIKEGDRVVQPRVRYPADISMGYDLDWAPGVGRDRVIEMEHDRYRLSRM